MTASTDIASGAALSKVPICAGAGPRRHASRPSLFSPTASLFLNSRENANYLFDIKQEYFYQNSPERPKKENPPCSFPVIAR
ncbi:hypothetical protein ABC974_07735 [Sphingomonas oligophenolica]|uniref:Uncharacterized protein n=2 Tax=Sphingomonas oligophenolica TaxID=301154 RepID=A0ABU9Y126_9SPHN